MPSRPSRLLRLLLVLACAWLSGGCYVASVSSPIDAASIVFDETLLGRWKGAEDETELVIARDEWRSYAVTWRDRSGEQRFTGRLATIDKSRVFDLTLESGTDAGPALLPVHIVGRVARNEDSLMVEVLDYEWFRDRLLRGTLGLPALVDERETVLVTASRSQLRRWLAARGASAPFTEVMTLTLDTTPAR